MTQFYSVTKNKICCKDLTYFTCGNMDKTRDKHIKQKSQSWKSNTLYLPHLCTSILSSCSNWYTDISSEQEEESPWENE